MMGTSRILLSAAVMLAMLPATSPPLPVAAQAKPASAEPMCRRPAALDALPRETERRSEQRERDEPMPVVASPAPSSPDASSDGGGEEGEIAVTGSRIDRPSLESPSPITTIDASEAPGAMADTSEAIVTGEARRPGPDFQPQSGVLTAGDHDDLLNPELYARYVKGSNLAQAIAELPALDTRRALTIAVTDAAGQPMPLSLVELTCADGNSLALATLADGTAAFFPGIDRLGSEVRVAVKSGDRVLGNERRVLISDQPGSQRISLTMPGRARAVGKLDVLLVMDTTGSMGDELAYLKAELATILGSLKRDHPALDIRIGSIMYRDLDDDYVTRSAAFTGDLGKAQAHLRAQDYGGGGDYPEAMDQALNRAVNFQWRDDAVKSLLLVADAPPHDDKFGLSWAAAEVARAKRIQIVPVAASGVADKAEYLMRAMAAATQSRYIFLTDDSGVGNPHAAPAIDCYLVTKLDALVRRVLDSQVSGRRIEPGAGEVIRTVGKYDAGKCVLPADF